MIVTSGDSVKTFYCLVFSIFSPKTWKSFTKRNDAHTVRSCRVIWLAQPCQREHMSLEHTALGVWSVPCGHTCPDGGVIWGPVSSGKIWSPKSKQQSLTSGSLKLRTQNKVHRPFEMNKKNSK